MIHTHASMPKRQPSSARLSPELKRVSPSSQSKNEAAREGEMDEREIKVRDPREFKVQGSRLEGIRSLTANLEL